MEMTEFLNRSQDEDNSISTPIEMTEEIDIQKAVVESLAADKAEQGEMIESLKQKCASLEAELSALKSQVEPIRAERDKLRVALKKAQDELSGMADVLLKNSESERANQISLLDRSVELDDRFEGETREHVLEVLKAARDASEKNGHLRRAQVLEGVLVANEPTGELSRRREEIEKIFTINGNIISGTVINELDKIGISYKNGEDYLLPDEIIARNY